MSFTLLYFKKPFCRLDTTDWSKLFLIAIIGVLGYCNVLNAQNLNKSVDLTTADPGEVFEYTLDFTCPSTVGGDCDNVILTDIFPPEVELVNLPSGCSGCTFDAATGTFTGALGTIANGSTISLTIQVRFPVGAIDGAVADNTATVDYDQGGTPFLNTSPTVSTTLTNGLVLNFTDEVVINKLSTDMSPLTLTDNFELSAGHTSDQTVTSLVLEDVFPDGMIFDGMWLRQYSCDPPVDYNVEYLVLNTTTATDAWVASTQNPYNTATTYNFTASGMNSALGGYALAADEYIKGFRITYLNAPGDGCFHPDFLPFDGTSNDKKIEVDFFFDETITGFSNPVAGDNLQNCADGTAAGLTTDQDCGGINVLQLEHRVNKTKLDNTNTGPYEPGEIVEFLIRYANSSPGSFDIVNPTMVDILPAEFEYIGNLNISTFNTVDMNPGSTTLVPTVTVVNDFNGVPGQTRIDYTWTDADGNGITLPAGGFNAIELTFEVRVRASAPDGATLTNTLYAFDPIEPENCNTVDVFDLDGDGDVTDIICQASDDVDILYPPGFAGLNSYKEVLGNLDTDFSRFPISGMVSPNGNIEYNLCLENPINLPQTIDDIVLVDVLPHVGDRGVVANDELRETVWQPTFTATSLQNLQTYVASIPGATLFLSTECEPCLSADLGAPVTDLATCSPPNWSTTPPMTISDVCAFKIEYGTTFELVPGDQTCINLNLEAPASVPTDGSIAWNSFGYTGNKDNGDPLLASEPIKVGVASFESLVPCEEVSGVAFLDANNDGCQAGADEVGVEGMIASIFECDAGGMSTGPALATDTTDVNGDYAFGTDEIGGANICLDPALTYTVTFSFPADGSLDSLNFSTGDPAIAGMCDGTDSADDSAANDGSTGCFDPSADADDEHIDIGLYPTFICELTINPIDDVSLACGSSTGSIDIIWVDGTAPYDVSVTCTDQTLTTTPDVDQVRVYMYSSDCDFPDNVEGDIVTMTSEIIVSSVNGLITITNVTANFPDTNEGTLSGLTQNYSVTGPFGANSTGISTLANSTDAPGTITVDYVYNGFPHTTTIPWTLKICQGGSEETDFPVEGITGDCPAFLLDDTTDTSLTVPDLKACCYDVIVTDANSCKDTTMVCILEPTGCCADLGGVAFLDANNDGCQAGADEIGVEGMIASVFECDAIGMPVGVALTSDTTAADGSYAFGPDEIGGGEICLDPDKTYTVTFSFPADGSLDNVNFSTGNPAGAGVCNGTDSADDSAANDGTTGCVDPSADTDDEHIDIGLYPCEEVSGVAFLDANNDGCQSGAEEIGVEGMEASIFACDANGVATGIALATMSTGADGSYAFGPDEIGAGMICLDPAVMYTVSFAFPADGSLDNLNYSTGDPAGAGACAGTDSSDDSAANDGTTGCVDPSADTDDEHIDIGLYPCEEVSGVAFLDANNDGCQSGTEEVGVEGMEASLFACDANGVATGTALATVSTGADGSYAFGPNEIGAGMICLDPAVMYTVSFAFPADGSLDNLNYSTGDPAAAGACAGTDSSDDSAANDGTTGCVDPSADTDDEHIDIGLYPCETVAGVVFVDADEDGCQAMPSDGVEGVTVELYSCNSDGTFSLVGMTVTGVDGSYAFGPDIGPDNVCLDPALEYRAQVSAPSGFSFTEGSAAACPGDEDDSPANDGISDCYNPSDDDLIDMDADQHIDFGIYCGVKTDAIFTGSGNACYILGGNAVYRNIVTDDSEILPPGYQIVYILVDETGTIVLFNTLSEYFIADYGMFMAYSVAYDPNDYDVTTATTIEDITSNWTCGDISAPAQIRVVECCLASSGWLTDGVTTGCADPVNGTTANLTATQKGLSVPTGYQVVYLLRDGLTDILLDYSFTLSFDVDQIGSYFISPLVYDPANLDITAINYGTEDIFSFNSYLFGLDVCEHFNISGVQLLVEECCQDNTYIPGAGIGVDGGLYEVSQMITSDGIINSGNVEYSAGNSIELMAGFEVEIGMEFHAFIEGCN